MAATKTLPPADAPPHSPDAERSVLGALLLHPGAWDDVAERLREGDFFTLTHQLTWRAIAELSDAGQGADPLAVADWFEARGEAERVEGGAYLTQLANRVGSSAAIVDHARIVREHAVRRRMLEAGHRIGRRAHQPEGDDAETLLAYAETEVLEIGGADRAGGAGLVRIGESLQPWVDTKQRQSEQGEIVGLTTGYPALDKRLGGLRGGDLIVVAGRPAMGKTALALCVAAHVAATQPAAFASLEMSREQLIDRQVSARAELPLEALRTPSMMRAEDWHLASGALREIGRQQLYLDDTPAVGVETLRRRWMRMQRRHGLALGVVDYLQIMSPPTRIHSRTEQITWMTGALKGLARALDIPIICLSQLNRELERRPNKRPVMADLRDSGSIEQDADVILFPYRPAVYRKSEPDDKTELIAAKVRNGVPGTDYLRFEGTYTRFDPAQHSDVARWRSGDDDGEGIPD